MNEKKSLFSFTKMNKYYLLPFITPIAGFICNLFASLLSKEIENPNFFFFPILNCLSDLLAGLIYFVQLYKNKNNSKIDKKIEKKKEKNKCKIICLIIFMAFLTCPMYICYNLDTKDYFLLPFSLDLFFQYYFLNFY